ncbi:hypothetical protein [Streptomyces sp. 7-21]|jgi:hypothetical protein|uniref:hypothetical protein n=1 Tax=Streptomyces sp. 7-21 TaxID=2802283 RepID=UPI00191FD11F|nr:hypothetical protein [Streptomyces sp. 7-21]MBL1068958.1 hypothetical protein [Streptomyces sp. 7-21]
MGGESPATWLVLLLAVSVLVSLVLRAPRVDRRRRSRGAGGVLTSLVSGGLGGGSRD